MRNTYLVALVITSFLFFSCRKTTIGRIYGEVAVFDKSGEHPLPGAKVFIEQHGKSKRGLWERRIPTRDVETTYSNADGTFDFGKVRPRANAKWKNYIYCWIDQSEYRYYIQGPITNAYGMVDSFPAYKETALASDAVQEQHYKFSFYKAGVIDARMDTVPGVPRTKYDTTKVFITNYKKPLFGIQPELEFRGNYYSNNYSRIKLVADDKTIVKIERSVGGVRTYEYDTLNIAFKDTTIFHFNF